MVLIKEELVKKMGQCNLYTIDFMYQSECIINYFLQEEDLYSTITNKKYLNRVNSKKFNKYADEMDVIKTAVPTCEDVPFSMSCMEHLDSMVQRSRLEMQPEISLMAKELGLSPQTHADMLVIGLRNEPMSWRYPTLSSYYWRSKGMAGRAIACARRAIFLAPRKYKDIPLLSLGTILQRANRTRDALVVLTAAVDHAPTVAENQLALANAFFMQSDFNRSIECLGRARQLDEAYAEREQHMRKSINCFKFTKLKLKQIENQLHDMKSDLDSLMESKDNQHPYYEKLLREQVPIATRLLDPSFENYSHHLLNRGQYCAIRKTSQSKEPVLLCDFYSDFQSQMITDSSIDTLQNFIIPKMGFIKNQWNRSLGVYKNLDIESYEGGGIMEANKIEE